MIKKYEKMLNQTAEGLSKFPFVSAIILFGSQINGNAKGYSDIDIAVMTEKFINEKEQAKISGFSNEILDISLFHKLPLIIQFRVIKDGKIIFCRNKALLHEIKFNTIRKYLVVYKV